MLLMMQMFKAQQKKDRRVSEDSDDAQDGRLWKFGVVRKLHQVQKSDPDRVLAELDQSIIEELGVPPGGAWNYRAWTKAIGLGHLKGIARCHGYVGDILQVLKAESRVVGESHLLCAQLLKALHQAYLGG